MFIQFTVFVTGVSEINEITATIIEYLSIYVCLDHLFSTSDGPPIVASGSPQGHIAFWDLERRQLVTQQRHAHSTAIAAATFLHGEPVLVTNAADNAIKVKQKNEPT